MLLEGHLPENDNEIVISKVIQKDLDVTIGDIVYLKSEGTSVDYMVVGIDQKINHFGRKSIVSIDGIRRLKPASEPAGIYITLEKGYTYKDLKKPLQQAYLDANISDGQELVTASLAGIQRALFLVCALFLVATLLIVFFIIYMIGKSRIIEKRKSLGISKALGFTTRQLIKQNVIAILPVVTLGGILGMIAAIFMANPMVSIIFSSFGIGNCHLEIHPLLFLSVIILVVLDSILVTVLCSARIKKIDPVQMIRGDV